MRIPGITESIETGLKIRATANAAGLAQGAMGPVAAGYCWYVERYTTFNARANSICELFSYNSETLPADFTASVGDRAGRQDVSITANNAAADNAAPIYVPEGYWLVAFWSGLTVGDITQLSTQIAIHRKLLVTQAPWEQAQGPGYIVPDSSDAPSGLGEAHTVIPGQSTAGLAIPGDDEGNLP